MSVLALIVIAATVLLAANGANDVSRGIATLVGSGIAKTRSALAWGSVWTGVGACLGGWFGKALLQSFSGGALVPGSAAHAQGFALAVALAALAWVVLATYTRLPVSTTHAMVGAMTGAGWMISGPWGIGWNVLSGKFFLPLLLGPLLALVLAWLMLPILCRQLQKAADFCVCLRRGEPRIVGGLGVAMMTDGQPAECCVGESEVCGRDSGTLAQMQVVDGLHWISSAMICLARGTNDAPKILPLAFGAAAVWGLDSFWLVPLGAVVMAWGSWAGGRLVTETLAQKITPMSPASACGANLLAALLVLGASRFGLPVSTTHVSGGTLLGLGLYTDRSAVGWKTVREIALAWVVTLPATAVMGAVVYRLVEGLS
jgi:PiT family inorganic phosphate transporter